MLTLCLTPGFFLEVKDFNIHKPIKPFKLSFYNCFATPFFHIVGYSMFVFRIIYLSVTLLVTLLDGINKWILLLVSIFISFVSMIKS